MQIQDVIDNIIDDDAKTLRLLLDKNPVSEKQFIQILDKSFGITITNAKVRLQGEIGKVLLVLEQVIALKDQDGTKQNLINRLRSKNGDEAVNELLCHRGLEEFFSNYKMHPLFAHLPDGYLDIEGTIIPVEIKTRAPQIFDTLLNFFSRLNNILPQLETKGLHFEMKISSLDKKLTEGEINSVITHIKVKNGDVDFEKLATIPKGYSLTQKLQNIEYSLMFYTYEAIKDNLIKLRKPTSNCIYASITKGIIQQGELGYPTSFFVYLSDEAKRLLSEIVVKDCIEAIKNKPKEPRLIVIYSNHFADEGLDAFFKEAFEKYTKEKKGTCLIGMFFVTLDEKKKRGIVLRPITYGDNITESIIKSFYRPEDLKRN